MILWRISNHAALDGRGGLIGSARWHTAGHAIVYLAESPSGALMEILVHLELDTSNFPNSYKLLKVEAPDSLEVGRVREAVLADNWQQDLPATRAIGDEWLASMTTALLRVPSVIAPETFNVLLNPLHPDAARVRVLWHREYRWDKRFFKI